MDLYITTNLLHTLSNEELLVRMILTGIGSNTDNITATNTDIICEYIYNRELTRTDRRKITIINNAIQSLIDNEYIECIVNRKKYYFLKNCQMDINTDTFVIITLDELQTIMTYKDNSIDNYALFSFFVKLVSTINNKTKAFHMTQDAMSIQWKINKHTITKYNTILTKLKLIYIKQFDSYQNNGHKINNTYGRYCDKDNITDDATSYLEKRNAQNLAKGLTSKDLASIKMRFTHYIKGAKKYHNNPEEVKRLKQDCDKYNNYLIANDVDNSYMKPIDMSKFN